MGIKIQMIRDKSNIYGHPQHILSSWREHKSYFNNLSIKQGNMPVFKNNLGLMVAIYQELYQNALFKTTIPVRVGIKYQYIHHFRDLLKLMVIHYPVIRNISMHVFILFHKNGLTYLEIKFLIQLH